MGTVHPDHCFSVLSHHEAGNLAQVRIAHRRAFRGAHNCLHGNRRFLYKVFLEQPANNLLDARVARSAPTHLWRPFRVAAPNSSVRNLRTSSGTLSSTGGDKIPTAGSSSGSRV